MRLVSLSGSRRHWLALTLVTALGIGSAFVGPTRAEAIDLTGDWDGKAICKGFFDGDKTVDTFEAVLSITHVGSDLNMEFLGVRYNGAVQIDNAAPLKKAQGSFVACSTVNDYSAYSEMGSFIATLNLNRDTASTFKATSVYTTASNNFQTCKWSFKRSDTADPNILPCP